MKFLCIEDNSDNTFKASLTEECFSEAVKILLMTLPLGKVTSYSKIAEMLRTHPRNVARVLKTNNEPLIIPCHRVVHSDGSLGGYTFAGESRPDLKKKLLRLEGVEIIDDKIPKDFFVDSLL